MDSTNIVAEDAHCVGGISGKPAEGGNEGDVGWSKTSIGVRDKCFLCTNGQWVQNGVACYCLDTQVPGPGTWRTPPDKVWAAHSCWECQSSKRTDSNARNWQRLPSKADCPESKCSNFNFNEWRCIAKDPVQGQYKYEVERCDGENTWKDKFTCNRPCGNSGDKIPPTGTSGTAQEWCNS